MPALTVRIAETPHKTLRTLAEQSGESMQAVLAKAIEAYRRQQFLHRANEAYAILRNDSAAWQEELEERAVWDSTLSDKSRS